MKERPYRIIVDHYGERLSYNERTDFAAAKALFRKRCRQYPRSTVKLWASGGGWHVMEEY